MAALVLAAALALTGCSQRLPSGVDLVHRVAAAMAKIPAYRITGTSRAGRTVTSFRVLVQRDGDFKGTLDIAAPGSKTFRSDVIATAGKVYVRSATELAELGISSLPGNLDPATTWVLQPAAVGRSYRQSVEPFAGSGLAATLTTALKGTLTVRRSRLDGVQVLVVAETGGSSSLRLFVEANTDHLLELAITGDQPISLRYSAFGPSQPVAPPPSPQVYVPPTPAAPG
ncbi:MAG: hypothetical protein ACLQNU_08330 [Candidatus Dormibacteria bacterium]